MRAIKAIVNLLISLKGNLKRISGNSLSPLRAQNKHISAASHALNRGEITPKTQATYTASSYLIKVLLKGFHVNCYTNEFCSKSYMAPLLTHVAAAQKRSYQWCVSLTPNNTKTTGRMTCHCFLRPIRRNLPSSSYTTAARK